MFLSIQFQVHLLILLPIGALILKLLCHGMPHLQYHADGYEVFYQMDGGDILSAVITTNIELAITGVTILQDISCFVVAFGGTNTLPIVLAVMYLLFNLVSLYIFN